MRTIPLKAVASQTLVINLGNQACKIRIFQKWSGLYCDLYVNDVLILGGILCENLNRIVRDAYLGFIGDLMFLDNQGTSDPDSTGLGARFTFMYLELSDLQSLGFA